MCGIGAALLVVAAGCMETLEKARQKDAEVRAAPLTLVDKGQSLAPIIVFSNAPPFTRKAADELAAYIEKVGGVKPQVIEGLPDPVPARAIWVGFQPKVKELFPKTDFDFKNPEEILIAANDKNLVIVGRDRWDPQHMFVKSWWPPPIRRSRAGSRNTARSTRCTRFSRIIWMCAGSGRARSART